MSNYVYLIVNKVNQKLYFGSHCWNGDGVDPYYYGSGKIIKQAIKKYGRDNFIIQPIAFYDTVEECRQAEEELLTKYDIANNQYCYNIKNSAIGWDKGRKHTEDSKRKMSEARKGRRGKDNPFYGKHHTEETRLKLSKAKNYKKIPVVAIQKDTGKIRVFESQKECSRVLGLNYRKVNGCLKGRRKSTGGYLIKHLKRCSGDYKITKRKAKETEKIKLTTERKGTTPVIAIQKGTGRVRMFLSQAECGRVLGVHQGNINRCLKGLRKSAGGYTFKYAEQP